MSELQYTLATHPKLPKTLIEKTKHKIKYPTTPTTDLFLCIVKMRQLISASKMQNKTHNTKLPQIGNKQTKKTKQKIKIGCIKESPIVYRHTKKKEIT